MKRTLFTLLPLILLLTIANPLFSQWPGLNPRAWQEMNPDRVSELLGTERASARSSNGMTAIMFAARYSDNPAVLSAIIALNAGTHLRDENGWTAIHHAAAYASNPDIVAVLTEAGFDPNTRDAEGRTPAMVWAETNAVQDVFDRLADAGIDLSLRDERGNTVLHHAVLGGASPATLEHLISYGADLNATNSRGRQTPLYLALEFGHYEALSFLVSAGADVRGGSNLLSTMRGDEPASVFEVLLGAGARETAGSSEPSVVHRVVAQENLEALRVLIEHEVDIDHVDRRWNETPIMIAAERNSSEELIHALLDAGANGRRVDSRGRTAFDRAQENSAIRGSEAFWRLNDARF